MRPACARRQRPSIETAVDLARTHMVEARRSVGALRPNVSGGEDLGALRSSGSPTWAADDRRADRSHGRRAAALRRRRRARGPRHRAGGADQRRPPRARAGASRSARRPSTRSACGCRSPTTAAAFRGTSSSGFGMTSMQERADRIGASLTIVTAPRSGTEVVLAWEPSLPPIPGPCPQAESWRHAASAPAQGARAAGRRSRAAAHRRGQHHQPGTRPPRRRRGRQRRRGARGLRSHRPDVTLLDLRMPVMEGVEVVRRIREIDPRAA